MTYYPVDLARAPQWLGFHIAGLAQDVKARFVAGVHLTEIPWSEWLWVERREIVDLSTGYYIDAHHVFACFGYGAEDGTLAELAALTDMYREINSERVRLLIWALRLHKSGLLLDPEHSVIYAKFGDAATTKGSTTVRQPGLYRQRLMEDTEPTYVLNSDDVGPVENLVALLEVYEAYWKDPAVDIALRAFNRAYTPYLTPAQRLVFLFPALEGVYGEYRNRNAGVSLGAVASVLACPEQSEAIREYLDGDARILRNHVGHGPPVATPLADRELQVVEDAVRTGLHALVDFTIRFRELANDAGSAIPGVDPRSPTRTFVALLTAAAKDEPAGLELLQRTAQFRHGLKSSD